MAVREAVIPAFQEMTARKSALCPLRFNWTVLEKCSIWTVMKHSRTSIISHFHESSLTSVEMQMLLSADGALLRIEQ
jgi:hypothetical protein